MPGSLNKIFETFDAIEATSGTNEKLALFEGLLKLEPVVTEEFIRFTYNPLVNYFVTPDMPTNVAADMTDEQLQQVWDSTKTALGAMSRRELSGNDAKRAMQMILEALPPVARKYFYRIFARDLKIGMASKIFARYIKGLINESKPFLCEKFDARADRHFTTIKFPVYVEPKYDGVRAVFIVDELGGVTVVSRDLKPFYNCEPIMDAIKRAGLSSVVLDGELHTGDFTETNALTRTQKPHPARTKLKYYMFDAMPLVEWQGGAKGATLKIEARKAYASAILDKVGHPIQPVPSTLVTNKAEFTAMFDKYVEMGFEGVVFKAPGGVYRFKRHKDWLKWKPVEEADVVVSGAELGDPDGWAANMLGKFHYKGYVQFDGQTYYVEGKVGSGLKPSERPVFWNQHQMGALVGTVLQIEYQEPCAEMEQGGREVIRYNSKNERIWSLRFPVYVRIRPDKTAEQVLGRTDY